MTNKEHNSSSLCLNAGLGWTFQFLYSSCDAKHRVHAPYWSDMESFDDAIKEAQVAAKEMNAKIGFYLRGQHMMPNGELSCRPIEKETKT